MPTPFIGTRRCNNGRAVVAELHEVAQGLALDWPGWDDGKPDAWDSPMTPCCAKMACGCQKVRHFIDGGGHED